MSAPPAPATGGGASAYGPDHPCDTAPPPGAHAGGDPAHAGAASTDATTAGADRAPAHPARPTAAPETGAGGGPARDREHPSAARSGRDAVALAPRARLLPALGAVYRAQLSRARVARIPLLFVATFQSVGIMILMRGVVDDASGARAVVAGSSVLVVAFVALNLLAQYFGQLRAAGGLDHYATLPVPPAAVVLGTAAAYASFTVPGTVVTAVVGCGLFQLPLAHLWVLVAVIPLAGAALSGLGAALGLLAPRPELATLLGQLGMSAALLLGVLPAGRMPEPILFVRDLLPSTYGVEAFVRAFGARPDWPAVGLDLAVCAAVGVVSLAAATWAYRRAAVR
ncbi:ABC transporter permease [Streptomyces sulfonofaciens]|uniref:ABC transporter permease n=1 Tax=Streptomyces sulfonofaciens TaxID=68272 RepID=UPI001E33688A|nr:ABC transporter permease [Streptomyces sulfonofaciens]